jgi:predicted dehydrogenase
MLALCAGEYIPGNVDRMYAAMWEDITNGTRVAPDFNDALELHRLIDRIEQAALQSFGQEGSTKNYRGSTAVGPKRAVTN